MTTKLQSAKVVPPGSVEGVRAESPWERSVRIFWETGIKSLGAFIIAVAGFSALLLIVFSDSPHVDPFRQAAFTALVALISAATALLFGAHKKGSE